MATSLVPLGELGTDPFGAGAGGAGKPVSAKPAAAITASSPVLDPLRYPVEWTYAKANDTPSPGVIQPDGVSGFEREEKWDVKAGKGTTGATTTHVAMEPAKGSIKFTLWKVEHFAAWVRWLAIFRFDVSKKTGQAVTISHPALSSVQPPITSVVMTKHSPITVDSKGQASVTIELLEYFPAKATGASTASGARQYTTGRGNASGTQPDPAIVALQKQASALAKQVHGTA
jgi:hypothetical protein